MIQPKGVNLLYALVVDFDTCSKIAVHACMSERRRKTAIPEPSSDLSSTTTKWPHCEDISDTTRSYEFSLS